MRWDINDRCIAIADYIIATNATVRQAARVFGVSKSTVHMDITSRMREINHGKFARVAEVLETNKSVRHLRGGLATKEKYLRAKIQSASKQRA